jgi:hypothetical protein
MAVVQDRILSILRNEQNVEIRTSNPCGVHAVGRSFRRKADVGDEQIDLAARFEYLTAVGTSSAPRT